MLKQRTLKNSIKAVGIGLHTGKNINMELIPSDINTGINFIRTDIDENLINKINQEKKYHIRYINSKKETKTIENIKGINLSDTKNLSTLIKKSELITTSVGSNYVKDVVNTVSDNNPGNDLNFIAFENKYRCSTTTKTECEADDKNLHFIENMLFSW